MNARPDSTDSLWWRVFLTPVGPRFIIGRRLTLRRWLPRRWSAGELIAESTLSADAKALIADVVARTRLWRREKADVARELIAHFEDAMSRDVDPEQVLHDFGEARQAAKLIRRAKKRNRPLIWHAWRRTLHAAAAALCLSIALYGVLIVRYFSGSPLIARDYTAEVNATILAVPEHERAWPLYREALLALEVSPLPAWEVSEWPFLPADAPQWGEARRVIAANQKALDLIRRAAHRPHIGYSLTALFDPEIDRHLQSLTLVPETDAQVAESEPGPIYNNGGMRWLYLRDVRVLVDADARLAILDGDGRRLFANLLAIIGLADQQNGETLFIDQILSLHLLSTTTRLIDEALKRSPGAFDDEQLVGLAHRLSVYAGGGPIQIRFDVWRMYFADFLQRLYTDDGDGDGRLTSESMEMLRAMGPEVPLMGVRDEPLRFEWLKGPLAAQLIAGRRDVSEEFERQLSLMERQAAQPMWEWKEVPGTTFENQVASPAYYRRYLPLFVMLPAIGRSAMVAESATQRRDAALTAIALELYRRRNGAYPARLDDLVPNCLPALPIDRFDGQPLRYLLTDDGPLLYSVGADRIDDGGAAPVNEEDAQRVAPHWFRIPADPMNADWILWDGRRRREDSAP